MKFLKNFIKHTSTKINELFDDTDLKDRNEIDYLSNTIDKKELSKTTEFYSNRINNMILLKLPFYKKGKPEVYPNYVKYTFGDRQETLAIVIEGELINNKYDRNAFRIHYFIIKNGRCLNPNDAGDAYNIDELLDNLEASASIIEEEFNITEETLN